MQVVKGSNALHINTSPCCMCAWYNSLIDWIHSFECCCQLSLYSIHFCSYTAYSLFISKFRH